MRSRWLAGEYIGDSRAIARVTIQQGAVSAHENNNRSIIFNNDNTPIEVTAIKSVTWNRSLDADVADCTIQIWNTADLQVGEQPYDVAELGLPGIYTYQLDDAKYGRIPNEIGQLIVPDNIIRTYEGWGFDAGEVPESDPNLVSTGTWLIDEVTYDVNEGVITVQARDFGRILLDQVAFPPVVPDSYYPLWFKPGGSYSYNPPTVTTGNAPNNPNYSGPTGAPTHVVVVEGDGRLDVTFEEPDLIPGASHDLPAAYVSGDTYRTPVGYYVHFPVIDKWYSANGPGQVNGAIYLWGDATRVSESAIGNIQSNLVALFATFGEGHRIEDYIPRTAVVQYYVYVDGRLQPIALGKDDRSFAVTGLINGNVYDVELAAVYRSFENGAKQIGVRAGSTVSPNQGGPEVNPNTISVLGTTFSFDHSGSGSISWTVIQYKGSGQGSDFRRVHTFTSADAPTATTTLPPFDGNDEEYSYLVYGTQGGDVGPGASQFASSGQADFYRPPAESAPPIADYTAGSAQPITPDQAIPRDTVAVDASPSWSSRLERAADPDSIRSSELANLKKALDGDESSYWSSDIRPSSSSWVFAELSIPATTLAMVRVKTRRPNVMAYVCVYSQGQWRSYSSSHNAPDGTKYLLASALPEASGDFFFQEPVAGVTKVRVVLRNLYESEVLGRGNPGTRYHAEITELQAHAPKAAPSDPNDTDLAVKEAHSVTTIGRPAGEGATRYGDYTDIVKILLGWGGFLWPYNGTIRKSDGTDETITFGDAPFNIGPAYDLSLGGDYGRIWGDLENSGTSGPADLEVPMFDKKPLMDIINEIRDILGFVFYVDEDGGVVWRHMNIYNLGNWILNRSPRAGWTAERVTLDERINLMSLSTTISSANVREGIYVANEDVTASGGSRGYNPNPIGLRRVAGWTDQGFQTKEECTKMAEQIGIRQMLTYRQSSAQIPGYPGIQVNDQVQIRERQSQEDYIHLVTGISSSNDLVSGVYTYDLTTHWLGTDPGANSEDGPGISFETFPNTEPPPGARIPGLADPGPSAGGSGSPTPGYRETPFLYIPPRAGYDHGDVLLRWPEDTRGGSYGSVGLHMPGLDRESVGYDVYLPPSGYWLDRYYEDEYVGSKLAQNGRYTFAEKLAHAPHRMIVYLDDFTAVEYHPDSRSFDLRRLYKSEGIRWHVPVPVDEDLSLYTPAYIAAHTWTGSRYDMPATSEWDHPRSSGLYSIDNHRPWYTGP